MRHQKSYKKVRKEMKAELGKIIKNNPTLMLLIRYIYIAYYQRHLLRETWDILGSKHYDIYKNEFCGKDGLAQKMLCGAFDEFLHTIYYIDKEFYEKYVDRVPEKTALGDAYAVAISCMRSAG